eukprot:SAG22_NODE_2156_length_2919_cov_1.605674_4_plen_184_part_00
MLLANYIWCGESTVGAVQLSSLSQKTLDNARRGLAILDAGRVLKDLATSRALFVAGLGRLGPGPLREVEVGYALLRAGLAAGYEPVEHKEHVAAIDALQSKLPADDAAAEAGGDLAAPVGGDEGGRPGRLAQAAVLIEKTLELPSAAAHGVYDRAQLLSMLATGQHRETELHQPAKSDLKSDL